jgi:photosystem II stability/assembly factor-like uncharacterized protein
MKYSNIEKYIPVLGIVLGFFSLFIHLCALAQIPTKQDKGNKWILRYEYFGTQRTRAHGRELTSDDIRDAARLQSRFINASRASDSAWIPEGPNIITPSMDPNSSHGVCRINCVAFHPSNPDIFWVGVAQGGVWKTEDGGISWLSLTDELPVLRISDIAVDPNHPDTLYISVCDYAYIGIALHTDGRKRHSHYGLGVYKSVDGGQSWQPTGLTFAQHTLDESLIRRVFVHPDSSEVLCAAGFQGVWKSNDGGQNWRNIHSDLIWDIEANPKNPKTLFATGGFVSALNTGKAYIARSHDFGETWQTLPTGIPQTGAVQRIEITVAQADTQRVYAVACGMDRGFYAFYRSFDGGNTWNTRTKAQIGKNILEWGSGRSSGGQGTYDLCILADPANADRVFVGGINLWGSADSGSTWDGISYWLRNYGYTPHADQHQLAANPLDNRIYVCNDGGLFRTSNLIIGSWTQAQSQSGYQWPTVWQDLSGGMQSTSFYRLALSRNNPGYIAAGAQDNSSFYRLPDGRWYNLFGGDGMDCNIHPDFPNEVIASSQFGNFYWTQDTGLTYFSISFDIIEEGEWTTPLVRNPQDSNHLLAAYANVWETKSLSSWTMVSSFSGASNPATSLALCTKYPRNMAMARRPDFQGGSPGELWVKKPKDSWKNRTMGLPDSLYITQVIIDDSLPDKLWVTCAGFEEGQKVFYSPDGGITWQNISRNLPNIPVNCIVQDECSPLNTVYIGTDHGIYYTHDSLNEWKTRHHALPAVIVSDLEIQYKERRMYAATFGRGVWSVNLLDTVNCNPYLTDDAPEDTVIINVSDSRVKFEATVIPNPVSETAILQWELSTPALVKWRAVDALGRNLGGGNMQVEEGLSNKALPLTFAPGVYYLELSAGVQRKVLRFVAK